MFTYCIYNSKLMTECEAAEFMLGFGDYQTFDTVKEATEHCEIDLAEKPRHYEGAVFSVGSPA